MAYPTIDEFLAHTATHAMKVHQDDGLYRHVTFSKPGEMDRHFNITTWPGHLCISGDMGCFVFARTSDMFGFFRNSETLGINPGYWAEKIQAGSSAPDLRLYMDWDEDAFRTAIQERFDSWVESDEPDEETRDEVQEQLQSDVFDKAEFEEAACVAVSEFYHSDAPGLLDDFLVDLGSSCHQYTHHYIWCCYAIVWGIKQYDEAKQETAS